MFFGPGTDGIEVTTFVVRVEVDIGFQWRIMRLIPNLAKDAGVDGAHELLANDVEAVR